LKILEQLDPEAVHDAIKRYFAAPTEQNSIESMRTAPQYCVSGVHSSIDWHTSEAQRSEVSIEA